MAADPSTGLVYSLGGVTGDEESNSAYAYNPATGQWAQLRSMKNGRAAAVAAFIGGRLYVAGGISSTGPTARVAIYDPATDTGRLVPACQTPITEQAPLYSTESCT